MNNPFSDDVPVELRKSKVREIIRLRRGSIINAAIVAKVDPVWLRNMIYRTDPLKVDVSTFMELARVCRMNPLTLFKKLTGLSQESTESK